MDVKINTDNQKFKFRVNCVILDKERVLAVKIGQNDFYCCPGGHVHLGEDTYTAVMRETMEEVGVEAKKQTLIAVMENFFGGENKHFHELSFYYLMEDAIFPEEKLHDYSYLENDEGKLVNLDFKWINLDDLDKFDFRPSNLKEILKNRDFSFHHIICKE